MKVVVDVTWDGEASVWYALARGKIGLATESASLDGLSARILTVLPDLFELDASTALDVELVVHGLVKPSTPIAA